MSWDGGVGRCAFATSNVPCVAHHQLKVVILVNACADIIVVLNEFLEGDLSVLGDSVPLLHELVQDIVLGHLTALKLRVEGDVVDVSQVLNINDTVIGIIQLVKGHLDELFSVFVHATTDTSEELIVAELSVVVLVEVLEDALELRWAEVMAVLAKSPHEFGTVHLAVTVIVHAAEDEAKSTDSMGSSGLESFTDLLEDLVGWLTRKSEGWVHVGVVSTSLDCHKGCKLFVVKLVVAILVVLVKDSAELEFLIAAADSFHGLCELSEVNCAESIEVEML